MKDGIKIAISGKSGCGNSTVSRLVAKKLGLRMINFTFRQLAEEKNMEFWELCKSAETDFSFDRELDRRQVEMADGGNCVLGSRLAVWMLRDADLKVFLTASSDVRAGRIQKREGGDPDMIRRATQKRDRSDTARYSEIYGIDNDDYGFTDLIINSDRLDENQVAGIIIAAAESIS